MNRVNVDYVMRDYGKPMGVAYCCYDCFAGVCHLALEAFDRTKGAAVDAETLADRKFVKRSMLTNPFEKFERKRFLYYSKDLGVISMNHALQSRLSADDFTAIEEQMRADLADYYAKLSR